VAKKLLLWLLALPAGVDAQTTVQIREWNVPWADTRPRDPFVDRSGAIWFVGQRGDYVARFDPGTEQFRRFDLEKGTGPHNLIVDSFGMVWYAGNRSAHIGRLDPATGNIRKFSMPDTIASVDPHTLIFDRHGNIWFTAQQAGVVGRRSPTSGQLRLVRVQTERSRPYGIVIDTRGRVRFNEFGAKKIGMVDPQSFTIREFDLPHDRARSRRIEVTSDGAVWYVDYVRGKLARLDPNTGTIREYPTPSGEASLPYALAVDDRGRLWFVETGVRPNRFVGMDSRTGRIIANVAIPSGGGAVRHMVFHKPTRSIWFGTDANTIGRAQLPD
jgi:virginiamycin B lyase